MLEAYIVTDKKHISVHIENTSEQFKEKCIVKVNLDVFDNSKAFFLTNINNPIATALGSSPSAQQSFDTLDCLIPPDLFPM